MTLRQAHLNDVAAILQDAAHMERSPAAGAGPHDGRPVLCACYLGACSREHVLPESAASSGLAR